MKFTPHVRVLLAVVLAGAPAVALANPTQTPTAAARVAPSPAPVRTVPPPRPSAPPAQLVATPAPKAPVKPAPALPVPVAHQPTKDSPAAVREAYRKVGQELAWVQAHRGHELVAELWPGFRMLRPYALTTAEECAAAAAMLDEIHMKLERLRGIELSQDCLNNPLTKDCQ